jgi:probable F420-dependent oxidoreductase
MAVELEVSLGLWQDRPPEEVIRTAALADAIGYRAVWIGEMATWDAFVLGAHVGHSFEQANLVLGPFAVAVRDPAMIAIGAASVATLTGRQVSVAVGTSSTTVVESWHGRERTRSGRALNETAAVLRTLLDGYKADFDGDVVRTRGYRLRLPAPKSELVVAAFGDRAIEAAAAHADTMVLNLVDPQSVQLLVTKLRAAAAKADRPCPKVAVWTTCAIDPGPLALEQLRRGVVGYLSAPGYAGMFRRAGYAELVDYAATGPHPKDLFAAVPLSLNQVVGLVGTASEVEARMREYLAAGADTIVIVPAASDEDPAGEYTMRVAAQIADRMD